MFRIKCVGGIAEMARIEICKLGPIKECAIEIENFTVLTGKQASGKSTVAKSVYFCKTVKDDIYDIILRRSLLGGDTSLLQDVTRILRNKFLQLFGSSMAMNPEMKLKYYYADNTYMEVCLRRQDRIEIFLPNLVWFNFSSDIMEYLTNDWQKKDIEKESLRRELNKLFYDEQECVFIPAGRSLLTLLTSQMNYLFATMDDEQKSSIDLSTQKYIERILKIRPLFSEGIDGLVSQKGNTPGVVLDLKAIAALLKQTERILEGKYIYKDGEERLYIGKEHFVKINYASSGQQETVWIFNILLHLMVNNTKAFLILEEPEAHLYPEAQKGMIDILALTANKSCSIMITTHSPYILGALNNLIYAGYLDKKPDMQNKVEEKVESIYHVHDHNAYFLENGVLKSCIEENDSRLIINEVIDGASTDINELYDRLFEIEYIQGRQNDF